MDPRRIIIPDATTATEDLDWSDEEHLVLFDHYPVKGPNGRCVHPMHDSIRRLIEGEGVDIEVTFTPETVLSDDELAVVEQQRAYEALVASKRDEIAQIEAKQSFLDAKDPQRPLRRAERRRIRREREKAERRKSSGFDPNAR